MNEKYKQLMVHYGGEIPFSVLGGVKNKKRTNRVKRKKRKSKTKRKRIIKYAPGTILRKNGKLYRLNSLKRWIKI